MTQEERRLQMGDRLAEHAKACQQRDEIVPVSVQAFVRRWQTSERNACVRAIASRDQRQAHTNKAVVRSMATTLIFESQSRRNPNIRSIGSAKQLDGSKPKGTILVYGVLPNILEAKRS